MSAKTAVWIVILILVVLGVWYFWGHAQTAASPSALQDTTSAPQNTGANASSTSAQNASAPATANTSNQSLNANLSQIDAQTQSATQSSASVDQSFNDTAVPQSNL